MKILFAVFILSSAVFVWELFHIFKESDWLGLAALIAGMATGSAIYCWVRKFSRGRIDHDEV